MNISAWFKSKTADNILSPVRELIIGLIDKNSEVLEIGCGTGDLLFKASRKIGLGLGVDLNQQMIDFANDRKQKEKCGNLEFICEDITSSPGFASRRFDVSTSTLCLHEMREEDAIDTLELLANHSSKLIIADYTLPRSRWGKISIELDEFISGHYRRFTYYRERGGMPYLAKRASLDIHSIIDTPIDGIQIWELGRNLNAKRK